MKKTVSILLVLFGCCHNAFAKDVYEIEKILDNGYYIINGVAWQPHSTCRTLQKGDKVSFIEGNANGDCVSAIVLDLNSNTNCKLWSKDDNLQSN